jgi:hypothetical protein
VNHAAVIFTATRGSTIRCGACALHRHLATGFKVVLFWNYQFYRLCAWATPRGR